MNAKFVVYATFLAKEGQYQELKHLVTLSGEMLDNSNGLIAYEVIEPEVESKPFVFIAYWTSKEAFETVMSSKNAQKFHSDEAIKRLNRTTIKKATAEFYKPMMMYHNND